MMKDTELQGDLRDEYLAIQAAEEAAIHEAIADEQELTEADLNDWHRQLLDDELRREEIEIWADFWKDHEDNA